MDGVRMVKVDNWAVFFLQKLQALYTRGDFTDLTLQFHTNECIKVHRLVLNTCTEYFETLIKQNNVSNHMRLPPTFQSDVVVPIINFMYSGRLEFRPELHQRLYNTAKILNMQILTKLLDTHAGTSSLSKPGNLKTKQILLPGNAVSPPSGSCLSNSRNSVESFDCLPGKKLPIWKKRSAPTSSFSLNVSTTRPPPEEPAKPTRFEWPDDGDSDSALIPYSSTFDDISYDSVPIVKSINSIVQSALPPSPSQPLVQVPIQKVSLSPSVSFESVYQSTNAKRDSSFRTVEGSSEGIAAKKAKVDMDEVKELFQEQVARKALITEDTEQENEDLDDFLPATDNDGEDFEDEEVTNDSEEPPNQTMPSAPINPHSALSAPKPILKVPVDSPESTKEMTPKKNVRFHLEPKVLALTAAGVSGNTLINSASENVGSNIQCDTPHENTPMETVSNEAVSENSTSIKKGDISTGINVPPKKVGESPMLQSKIPNASNHAKIITEVLKKYPDLVRNNKNIRLKIVQKDGAPALSKQKTGAVGDGKPKVSYMVVKADPGVRSKQQGGHNSKNTGVLNRTGPWLCYTCSPDNPINFDSYFNYRKHLKEVHNEKVDVRICEHCGHIANKRNLLLYHLYKVHGIPPPPNCKFPKCDECNHIALSEVLLAKHKNAHSASKDFICNTCNSGYKTHAALQTHLENSQRCNPKKKLFKCPICVKVFPLQTSLKDHIRSDHPHLKLLEDMETADVKNEEPQISQTLPSESLTQAQQQPQLQQLQLQHPQQGLDPSHQHTQDALSQQVLQTQASIDLQPEVHPPTGINVQPQTTYILPPGVTILTDNNQAALMPSTEAEALSNVASGIAASLGVADSMVVGDQGQHQTFIVVDKNSLIQIPGPPGNPGQVHEYIVPEIMANDMSQSVGVFSPGLSQLVQYTTAGALQQPVAVSTSDQGLMTITTVNANGSIVNHSVPQQAGAPMMETAMMQIPQGHIQDHSGGEITMILTDHPYSEGIVRENGTVMQATSVPVSMNMVPSSAVVVSAVPSISTTVPTSSMDNAGMIITSSGVPSMPAMVATSSMAGSASVITSMAVSKVDCASNAVDNSSIELDSELQTSAQPTQKMAELASDWDDVEETEDNSGLSRTVNETSEEEALPSRPSILLKNDLDGDIPDSLPLKMA